MNPTHTIAQYQPLLTSIALKIVGRIEDAEDIVQETFLKWLSVDQGKVHSTKAYLIKAVTNKCFNHLKKSGNTQTDSLDALEENNLLFSEEEGNDSFLDKEHYLMIAICAIQDTLDPLEKGVYLLREVFNLDYEEIQSLFGKTKDHCRQLLSRAKKKLSFNKDRVSFEACNAEKLNNFKKACRWGSVSDLVQEITQDISSKIKNSTTDYK